ncbi:MAG: hypothetical protein U0800_08700 [Isosphaeraceae bacterium]
MSLASDFRGAPALEPGSLGQPEPAAPQGEAPRAPTASSALLGRTLAEIKGQAQFLLYLAEQIEESLGQLDQEVEPGQATFLCKVLTMYSAQLESKHHGLGDKIAEACQEVYITVREHDVV